MKEKVLDALGPEKSQMGSGIALGIGIILGGVATWQFRNLLNRFGHPARDIPPS